MACASADRRSARFWFQSSGRLGSVPAFVAIVVTIWACESRVAAAELFGPAAAGFQTGREPVSIAVGDFNGDGQQDLASIEQADQTVSVLLGDGLGAFTRTLTLPVDMYPHAIVIGDFNRDGATDLAVACNSAGGPVDVFLGDGRGSFPRSAVFLTGQNAYALAVGDLNSDGKEDLAVADWFIDSVSLLLGDGLGGFSHAGSIPAFSKPYFVAIVDLDSDGAQDLAVANNGNDTVSVLLGNGLGGFTRSGDFPAGSLPISIAAGDFDSDGVPDLAVADNGDAYDSFHNLIGSVRVLFGDALGGFARTVDLQVSLRPIRVVVADFNADGAQDIATASADASTVSVLLGSGLGGFTRTEDYLAGAYPFSLEVGDFNSDGAEDLVTASIIRDAGTVLLGDGLGGFTRALDVPLGGYPLSVVAGDFNTDGAPDFVTTDLAAPMEVLFGDGQAGISRSARLAVAGTSVAVGDFNANGAADLAVTGPSNMVSILLGDGLGGFTLTGTVQVGPNPTSVAVGQFSSYLDSQQDLAIVNRSGDSLSVLLGDGLGGFRRNSDIPVGRLPVLVAVGSFDSNGTPDLAVVNSGDSTVSILLGNGRGGFARSVDLGIGNIPYSIVAGEFNDDGAQDLAVGTFDDGGIVRLFLGDGRGGFTRSVDLKAGNSPIAMAVGDFNHDGAQDLATVDYNGHGVRVLLGDGLGNFVRPLDLAIGEYPTSVVAGDFDGDGETDLAVANLYSRSLSLLHNQLHARADLNGSNRVDAFDVATLDRLAGCVENDPSNPCYRRNADVNLDGVIDGDDLALVASEFGMLMRTGSSLVAVVDASSPQSIPGTVTLQQHSSEADLLKIDVVVDDGGDPVGAADFAVTYGPDVLKFAGSGPGTYFSDPDALQVSRANETSPGIVAVTVDRIPSKNTIGSGAEVLLGLFFTPRGVGETTLGFAGLNHAGAALLDASGREVTGVSFVGGAIVQVTAPIGGAGGRAAIAPATLEFGRVSVGSSATRKVRVTNLGSSSLSILSVTPSLPDFTSYFTEAFEIPAHGFVELEVVFRPAATGDCPGEIVIETDDPSPARQRIHVPFAAEGN